MVTDPDIIKEMVAACEAIMQECERCGLKEPDSITWFKGYWAGASRLLKDTTGYQHRNIFMPPPES